VARVSVRWPDGRVSETTELPPNGGEIRMIAP
jgi:hypothetical protein